MKIIPAVDMMDGACVQLVGGKAETKKEYGKPLELAESWISKGAESLHVIDLDATLGIGDNTQGLLDIINNTDLDIQFGGGLRSIEKIIDTIKLGVDRVIVGTLAVKDMEKDFQSLKKINEETNSEKVIVSVDSLNGYVSIKGWQEQSPLKTTELINAAEDVAWGYLFTDVTVEGQMKGVNIDFIEEVVTSTEKPVIISGGISSPEDIDNIREVGAWGVVLGKALYEEKLVFEDIIK